MPVPPHLLISFRGILGTAAAPLETWSVNLRWALFGAPLTQAELETIHGYFATFIQSAGGRFTNGVLFEEARAYNIGEDGRMTDDQPMVSTGVAVTGATNTNPHPFQCSVVITHVADGPKKGRYGRIYLPPQGLLVDGVTGMISAVNATDIITAYKAFLSSMNSLRAGNGLTLQVVGSTGTIGTMRDVTLLKVGRVIDTQRRRRRSLDENYSEALEVQV